MKIVLHKSFNQVFEIRFYFSYCLNKNYTATILKYRFYQKRIQHCQQSEEYRKNSQGTQSGQIIHTMFKMMAQTPQKIMQIGNIKLKLNIFKGDVTITRISTTRNNLRKL